MNFELNAYHHNTPDSELIEDLQYVAKLINRNSVTLDEYNEYGHFHSTTLTRRFGSWFRCLELAGLAPSRSRIGISNEDLFEEIENIWTRLGRQPSYSEMRDMARFSIGTYEKRFGGWRKALCEFVNYINCENNLIVDYLDNEGFTKNNTIHNTPRTVNLRSRFLVLQRDNFKCRLCGASPAKDPSVELHVDHIRAWSKGGESVIDNLQTLCSKCNIGKSNLE